MKIAVIGTGYVGLVAGTCFAETGNDVICVDNVVQKIEDLERGVIPIYEPGLEELVKRNAVEDRLTFTTDLPAAVRASDVVFIAVGTPPSPDGSPDMSAVHAVAKSIGQAMNGFKVVVDKSTVPVGTAEVVRGIIAAETEHEFDVVSNPEFLKEGAAIDDFLKPDRVVIGYSDERSADLMKELYEPFVRTGKPILLMDVPSAELTKYASNSMLATRISFMNEMAALCERLGANVNSVRQGMGLDSRIGPSFLFPGIGYGGSCFPKDVKAVIHTADGVGYEMKVLKAVEDVNAWQKEWVLRRVDEHYGTNDLSGKTFAVWGLSFKPNTDDMREAPALVVIEGLLARGAKVQANDPVAMDEARHHLGDRITYCAKNYEALEGADALIVCTEWNEFRHPDFARIQSLLAEPVVFDGRNCYKPDQLRALGFRYYGVGVPDA